MLTPVRKTAGIHCWKDDFVYSVGRGYGHEAGSEGESRLHGSEVLWFVLGMLHLPLRRLRCERLLA
jgi:hypothetical protein